MFKKNFTKLTVYIVSVCNIAYGMPLYELFETRGANRSNLVIKPYQTTEGLSFAKGRSYTNVDLPSANFTYAYNLIEFPEIEGGDGFHITKTYDNTIDETSLWNEAGWHWQEPLGLIKKDDAKLLYKEILLDLSANIKFSRSMREDYDYSYGNVSAISSKDFKHNDSGFFSASIEETMNAFKSSKMSNESQLFLQHHLIPEAYNSWVRDYPQPKLDEMLKASPSRVLNYVSEEAYEYYEHKNNYTIRLHSPQTGITAYFQTKKVTHEELMEFYHDSRLLTLLRGLAYIYKSGERYVYDMDKGALLTEFHNTKANYTATFSYQQHPLDNTNGYKYLLTDVKDSVGRKVHIEYPDFLGNGLTILKYGDGRTVSFESNQISQSSAHVLSKITAFTDEMGNRTELSYKSDISLINQISYPSGLTQYLTYSDRLSPESYAEIISKVNSKDFPKVMPVYPVEEDRITSATQEPLI
ncbi:hypothetical protein, partial [Facilibium subflavum]|uniref:hypothetical protein n=1 Tax=Facilibium subflavum TaxID=2219058 RepID=UPI0013C37803